MRISELLSESLQDDVFIADLAKKLRASEKFRRYFKWIGVKKNLVGTLWGPSRIGDFVNYPETSSLPTEHKQILDLRLYPWVDDNQTLGAMITRIDSNGQRQRAIRLAATGIDSFLRVIEHELMHALDDIKYKGGYRDGRKIHSRYGRGRDRVYPKNGEYDYIANPREWNAMYAQAVGTVQQTLEQIHRLGKGPINARQLISVIQYILSNESRFATWQTNQKSRIARRFFSRLYRYAKEICDQLNASHKRLD